MVPAGGNRTIKPLKSRKLCPYQADSVARDSRFRRLEFRGAPNVDDRTQRKRKQPVVRYPRLRQGASEKPYQVGWMKDSREWKPIRC